jgi:hypothetical protein
MLILKARMNIDSLIMEIALPHLYHDDRVCFQPGFQDQYPIGSHTQALYKPHWYNSIIFVINNSHIIS